jgi:hypothetical protein
MEETRPAARAAADRRIVFVLIFVIYVAVCARTFSEMVGGVNNFLLIFERFHTGYYGASNVAGKGVTDQQTARAMKRSNEANSTSSSEFEAQRILSNHRLSF